MIGVDEVGRGCLAGPLLVVAARQIKAVPKGVTDSKKMSRANREIMHKKLLMTCQFGEGWVSVAEIDASGLTKATRLGVARALRALKAVSNESILIDGHINYAAARYKNVQTIIDGDEKIAIISAASVYAKVTRDRFMIKLAKKYLDYGFENHVGYGTKAHLLALQRSGLAKGIHRVSFAPIKLLSSNSL